MSRIQISNLTFAYDGSFDNIFENASFQLDTDWRLGLVGRNGRGKTTLLRLLCGELEGSGSIQASVQFEYFPYPVSGADRDTLTVLEAVCPGCPHWQLLRELSLLEVAEETLYRSFSTLSPGEQTKALLAALFLKENSFLLIDEPTNHLDTHGRTLMSHYLQRKSGFILVSHDRAFLDTCVDHILSLNKEGVALQQGNFSTWWQNRAQQDASELARNAQLKKEIKRLEATAREKADWANAIERSKIGTHAADRGAIGHKSAKMMQRAKCIEARQNKQIEEKSGLLRNLETADALKLSPLSYHSTCMVRVENVAVCYDGRAVCEPVSFTVELGDRIALVGRNGCGKSSLLKLIAGEPLAHTGTLWRGSGLRLSVVSQTTAQLRGTLDDFAHAADVDATRLRTLLRKLDFPRVQFEKDLADYSGGQKKKLLLAASLCTQAHLYLWDEPLNFIDVYSRMQLEELLCTYSPTLLFVEHDAAFCANVATKTVQL